MRSSTYKLIFCLLGLIELEQGAWALDVQAHSSRKSDLEPIKPMAVCERFVDGAEMMACQKQAQDLNDSYISALCNLQFSNEAFTECLSSASHYSFDPKKLSRCADETFSDTDRLQCLNKVGKLLQKGSTRAPASAPKNAPHKKRPPTHHKTRPKAKKSTKDKPANSSHL